MVIQLSVKGHACIHKVHNGILYMQVFFENTWFIILVTSRLIFDACGVEGLGERVWVGGGGGDMISRRFFNHPDTHY